MFVIMNNFLKYFFFLKKLCFVDFDKNSALANEAGTMGWLRGKIPAAHWSVFLQCVGANEIQFQSKKKIIRDKNKYFFYFSSRGF